MMSPRPQMSFVVTGASSGIGRATALLLVQRGHRVFAGVRREEDASSLRTEGGPGLEPILLDVTDTASIAAAAAEVRSRQAGRGLDGLVNNAGIGVTAPVEHIALDVLRRQFEVNVFGQVAVTQAFLPLVRAARGRIVNIGSVGAHITIPFGGALCGSKSAFNALGDALRMELAPSGIKVCTIEPGSIATPAVDKTLGGVEAALGALPPDGRARYGAMLRAFTARARQREATGSSPEVVARAVLHALTSPRPRIRYVVGRDARLLVTLPRLLPDAWLDALRARVFGITGARRPLARAT
jgi:NAD(P)-dependent dehydrogenase (short-subunit alcohol dehydrogenase family)